MARARPASRLEVARDLVGAYPDGVWLVELAPLSEGALVPQAVADALRRPEQPGQSLTDTLVDALREKQLLLVLDNCEHLVEAAARLSDTLLSSCPRLRVLATSREALGVEGELVWRVDPLSVPDADRDAHRGDRREELERYEAVRLFVERARLRTCPVSSSPRERRGGGADLPQARRDAARHRACGGEGRTLLAVEQIAQRLEDPLKLLTGGAGPPIRATGRCGRPWSGAMTSSPQKSRCCS